MVRAAIKHGDEVLEAASGALPNASKASSKVTKPYATSRPSYGKGQVEQVWENAKDPITGRYTTHQVQKLYGITQNREMVNGIWDIYQEKNIHRCINCIWMM